MSKLTSLQKKAERLDIEARVACLRAEDEAFNEAIAALNSLMCNTVAHEAAKQLMKDRSKTRIALRKAETDLYMARVVAGEFMAPSAGIFYDTLIRESGINPNTRFKKDFPLYGKQYRDSNGYYN